MTEISPIITPENTYRVVLHYWGRRGGGSTVTLNLAQHLASPRNNIKVFLSLAEQNSEMDAFRASLLPILTFARPNLRDLWRKAWILPQELRRHADALAALRPDAVIITMNSPFAWPFIHLLQRRHLRVVYVAHDAEPHPGDYAQLWQRMTQDRLIRVSDHVVTLSRNVADRIARRVPPVASRISAIPLEVIYPTERMPNSRQPNSAGPVQLLFYGRLLPYKGLHLLAQALEPLRAIPGWRLTIAGAGPLEQEVRTAFADWPQVSLELGWISQARTAELFSSHHLLLCPYVEASQSGVVAQAFSWSLPSLVMPAGALPEQVGHGKAGLVADTMDAAGFRRSLKAILEQPGRLAELSLAASEWLTERQSDTGWIKVISR
jgi:glycosyltransferase involved in cell wall biosynthesis